VTGYRGFLREFSRTGSLRALSLQLRTGVAHAARQLFGRRRSDPVAQFLAYYGPDGVARPEAETRALALAAQDCLVCGLCNVECARVGGAPAIEPRDAVAAAARLEVDWRRLGLSPEPTGVCAGCDACSRVCPAGIPIHRVQARLGNLAASGATPGRIG
jgi:succinate dehydrogenase/fumarate reductase-like Fe-S protein